MSEAPALKTGPGLHVITRTLGGVYDNTHPECARAVHPVRTHPTNGEPCTHPRRRRFSVSIRAADPVRTVVDDEKLGTVVSADVLRVDGESAFPLHAALGIELTQTLFIGPEVLFVEGPSDVVYLQYLSDQLKLAGRTGLDDRWTIVPGGGITKLALHR